MNDAAEKVVSLPRERSGRTFGTDELNICEFPLYSTGRGNASNGNTLVFEDRIFDEGTQEPVHRQLLVSASDAFGLPTPADSDVLLVLMHLTNQKNGFTDRTVHFTRYELVNALGWDHSGKSYRRIEESLQRWVNVTLNYNRAWWDRDCRRWQNKSFHILESVDLRGRGDSLDDGTSSFTWNHVIFGSFEANHVKRLDLDAYQRLKSPAAKQAYRFLDKRFYRTKYLEFDLSNFACEHIGLARSHDNGQLKRKLQPAIEELEKIGFLKPLPVSDRYAKRRRGEWIIRLIRESDAAEATPEVAHTGSDDSLLAELVGRGVHTSTARQLVAEFSEDRIREKVALLDWLTAKGGERAPKNPAGYLASAIREDYRPPHGFKPEARIEINRKAKATSSPFGSNQQAVTQESEKHRRALRHFRELSPEQQREIEAAAIATGNRFRIETYKRLQQQGGKLFDEFRDTLIADFLANQLASGVKGAENA